MTDWAEKLQTLDEARRRLLARRARERMPARPRLLAFAALADSATATPSELREWITDRLPGHMVPDAVVPLAGLPRLPNGKVDVSELQHTQIAIAESRSEIVKARSQTEEILAQIWSDLLGADPISVHDDFFELGGDSLISIRMISMARQEGLKIRPSDLADSPTIADLAKVAQSDAAEVVQEAASCAAPTPIQSWHLSRAMPRPAHWNQALRLELSQDVPFETVKDAIDAILRRHAGLRARFHQVDGKWLQTQTEVADFVLRQQRMNSARDLEELILSTSQDFSLGGPLLAIYYVDYSGKRGAELLIVANHLIIDAVSWSILIDDLDAAFRFSQAGHEIALAPARSSLDWALEVAQYADSDSALVDVAVWLETATTEDAVTNYGDEASADTISAELSRETTAALLGPANDAFNTQPLDLLVWALAEVQSERTGSAVVQIDLEGHGRNPDFSEMDLSRTIGWLTAYFPITLSLDAEHASHRGKNVKETLRRFLKNGIGFGAVRYESTANALRARLAESQTTDVLLNYAGPAHEVTSEFFALRDVPQSGLRAPENPRSHLYEFNVSVTDGAIKVALTYGHASDTASEAQAFMAAFCLKMNEIADLCIASEPGGFTPSDFPDADLSQDELDAFLSEI